MVPCVQWLDSPSLDQVKGLIHPVPVGECWDTVYMQGDCQVRRGQAVAEAPCNWSKVPVLLPPQPSWIGKGICWSSSLEPMQGLHLQWSVWPFPPRECNRSLIWWSKQGPSWKVTMLLPRYISTSRSSIIKGTYKNIRIRYIDQWSQESLYFQQIFPFSSYFLFLPWSYLFSIE